MRKEKKKTDDKEDFRCRIDGGSGFPAASCIAEVTANRGWKAAPTKYFI